MAVIDQCALERDLSLFDAGDETEVGEKGITLRFVSLSYSALLDDLLISSGGQKVSSSSYHSCNNQPYL